MHVCAHCGFALCFYSQVDTRDSCTHTAANVSDRSRLTALAHMNSGVPRPLLLPRPRYALHPLSEQLSQIQSALSESRAQSGAQSEQGFVFVCDFVFVLIASMLPSLVWLLCLALPRLASPRSALPCSGFAVTFALTVAKRRQSYRKRRDERETAMQSLQVFASSQG